MLGALRKRKNSPIITILLGLTALLMIGFGVSFQGLSSASVVAHVNGDPINELDFNAQYSVTFRDKQNQDRRYDRTRAEKDGLREQVLNSMMTSKILSQKGASLGLAVDDQALRSALVDDERFKTNGQFDITLYQRSLSYLRTTDRRFERRYREELLARPLTSILQSVGPSEAEVRARFDRDENKVNVSFVQFPKASYTAKVADLAPAELEAFKAKAENLDEDVTAYYQRNKRRKYDVPKQVCAQHILVKSAKEVPPDERAKHRAKITEALEKVKKGDDFAELAKKYSEDSSASKGGELGCFGPGQMVPPFEQAAFGLKKGEHSGIVTTNFGFHVIKVNDVKEAVQKKLEDVKDEIITELAKESQAEALAKADAEALLKLAQTQPDLTKALAEMKDKGTLTVEESGPFPANRTFLPKLGPAKDVISAAWQLTKEKPVAEAPVETDRAWVVLRLKEKIEPDEASYKDKRKFIVFQLTREKQEEVVQTWFENLRKEASTQIDPVAIRYDDEAQAIRSARRQF
ncbi:MAG: SurA N-terminal domain-containing protein [Myxococcota bacterium]